MLELSEDGLRVIDALIKGRPVALAIGPADLASAMDLGIEETTDLLATHG